MDLHKEILFHTINHTQQQSASKRVGKAVN